MQQSSVVRVGAAALLAGSLLVAGCAPEVRNHGYVPPDEDLAQIRVGLDTRGSVQRKIGRPGTSGTFTDDGWYYVATRVEHLTYHEPEVVKRTVVAITFDERDVVASVDVLDLDEGKDIALETEVTPTYGRTLTIIEQALGNIGVITGDIFED